MSNQKLQEKSTGKKVKVNSKSEIPKHLEHTNKKAAGIDVGSKSHFVAIPEGLDEVSVREFKSFTSDLFKLTDWLKKCGIETVAMESTGVYWIPLFELLQSRGFDVKLVDARHVKNVSGRKTDVLDCQWLQRLHTYGLLNAAFRPEEEVCVLRAFLRQRGMLIKQASIHIQHMQKALNQMNVLLATVISDITGDTGMRIIRSIVAGERDPEVLASFRNSRCKRTKREIQEALTGNYRAEHIFALAQALELFDVYKEKINDCDGEIEKLLSKFEDSSVKGGAKRTTKRSKSKSKNSPSFDAKSHLQRITGIDLTQIPGIEASGALRIISEIGLNMNRWRSSKEFASWLGLCPGNKVSGGKHLGGKTKRIHNNARSALRMAASTLHRSKTSLGAYLRRLKTRLGSPKAITAVAHKLAVTIYNMLKTGAEYVELGAGYYEERYRERLIKNLTRKARQLGYEIVHKPELSQA
jgi:transposase